MTLSPAAVEIGRPRRTTSYPCQLEAGHLMLLAPLRAAMSTAERPIYEDGAGCAGMPWSGSGVVAGGIATLVSLASLHRILWFDPCGAFFRPDHALGGPAGEGAVKVGRCSARASPGAG